ncbi:AraC family transcriptional regulator [Nocardia sp. alder85J]|uniref:AraC family transcriptional regulator n=1 Tax=Nocardia sp. alder85J TaxID=2862949 RepID=UPI001CD19C4B|nr:AraC family transcriptional regulator [Nocardia sp. alder85J]MCX4091382.1 AraC family transcriptional regulator [Nocardia sp. alder85J]
MDVLSDAIAAMRLGQPTTSRLCTADRDWCTRLSPYEGAGFHIVLRGSCWVLPDEGEPVLLGTGDAVLLPHGTGHLLSDGPADTRAGSRAIPFEQWYARREPETSSGTARFEVLCGKYRLDERGRHPMIAELPNLIHLPARVGDHVELRAAVDLLGREVDRRGPGSCIAVPSLLDLLLVYMIRAWMAESSTGVWPAVLGDPVTAAALRALHTDPAAPWSNESLAAETGVSRATLTRRFTALVGRPPMGYLTWWRLTRAAALLRDTTDPLSAIAGRVGYANPYAFSNAFKKEFGAPPGRYRENHPGAA